MRPIALVLAAGLALGLLAAQPAAARSAAPAPAKGTTHTSRLKPWRGGASRIQVPYFSTK